MITVASLLVGGAIGAQFAPQRTAPRGAARVWTEHPPLPPPPAPHFAEPPPPPPAPAWEDQLPECQLYVAITREWARCDKLPAEARQSIESALAQVEQGFAQMPGLPPDARAPTNDACRQAVDAVQQSMNAMGCAIQP